MAETPLRVARMYVGRSVSDATTSLPWQVITEGRKFVAGPYPTLVSAKVACLLLVAMGTR